MMHIADLHCDLLCYLEQGKGRTAIHNESRCSLNQLKEGGVLFQTLAIYTETKKGSVVSAKKQFEIFLNLPHRYPQEFVHLKECKLPAQKDGVYIGVAIENASGLCEEDEDLDHCFKRLEEMLKRAGSIIYISLTWNHENRFAGGNLSHSGLKKDGELLLEYLNKKNIAVDFSHASDATALDILNFIDKKGLKLIPIASHSNFRKICDQPRNLPDHLAQEIFLRGGVIGLNFIKAFVGKSLPEDFFRHIDYGRSIGGEKQLVLGADFFYDQETSVSLSPFKPFFHEPFGNSGCYPALFRYLENYLCQAELDQLGYKNLESYFQRRGSK